MLIEIIIAVLLVALIIYLLNMLPIDPRFKQVIMAILIVVAIIWCLQALGTLNFHLPLLTR